MLKKLTFSSMNWIMRLAALNILWLLTSLPLVTIFPSSFAMFSVINKWIKEDEDIPILKTFLHSFRSMFWKSYQFGVFYTFVGLILFVDYWVVFTRDTELFMMLRYSFLIVLLLFVITMIYSFPIYLNFDFSFFKTLLFSLMMGVRQPVITILMLCGILLVILLFLYVTGIGIFFLGSLSAFIVIKAAQYRFNRT